MQNKFKIKIWESKKLPSNWFIRTQSKKKNSEVEETAKEIIENVKIKGDLALQEYTQKFDKIKLSSSNLRVTLEEIRAAYETVSQDQVEALKIVKKKLENIEKQTLKKHSLKKGIEGVKVQTIFRPIESVGCYVPGGLASYPSTLVMTAVPAKVAGVSRIVACSPPNAKCTISPLVLVAADICGVNEIYKVGGVQAIAALAYGTKTIKPVRKIVGPGNRYVTMAKILVSQDVAIDMPAGPSEVLILADETANPKFIAADMISQAEHGTDSVVGLVTISQNVADAVVEWIQKILTKSERKGIIEKSLSEYGFIIICNENKEISSIANIFAPEHLEIMFNDPQKIAEQITSAGLVLIGPYSPVALSDYGSGTNHVLPTGGFGHSFSGLSALDFTRRINVVESTKESLNKMRNTIRVLTEAEGLPNHYAAVESRFEK